MMIISVWTALVAALAVSHGRAEDAPVSVAEEVKVKKLPAPRCDLFLAPLKKKRGGGFRTGVYAGRNFRARELLEVAPSVLMKRQAIEEWQIYDFSFETESKSYEMHLFGSPMMLAQREFGNVHHFWTEDELSEIPLAPDNPYTDFDTVSFFSKRDIARGEEIILLGNIPDDSQESEEEVYSDEEDFEKYSMAELRRVGHCLSDVYIDDSEISQAGQGLFAKKFMKKNEIVTISPVLILPRHKVEKENDNSLLINYCISRNDSDVALLPVGLAGMINHNNGEHGDLPNLRMGWHSWDSPGGRSKANWEVKPLEAAEFPPLYIRYVAERDIYPGEELTISYGDDWVAEWRQFDEFSRTVECSTDQEESSSTTDYADEPKFRHYIAAADGFFPKKFVTTCIGKNTQDCGLLEAKRKISLDDELRSKFNQGPEMVAAYRDKIHSREPDLIPQPDICKQSKKEIPLVYSKINPPVFDKEGK